MNKDHKIYMVIKEALYEHGVFFITDDKSEAIAKCKEMADMDVDDHHRWCVFVYVEDQDLKENDACHILVFWARKGGRSSENKRHAKA